VTGLLASVTNVEEAHVALKAGADIIDLKDPARGALGALPLESIQSIVTTIGGRLPVSATVGDLPPDPDMLSQSVMATAATGVDLIKVGLFGEAYFASCLSTLGQHAAEGARLIAVLFADLEPDFDIVARLAETGFTGIMLDTADKTSGGLRRHMAVERLMHFVQRAKQLGLLTGLAGSLCQEDIKPLLVTAVDYLGFRTALCRDRSRTAGIDPVAVAVIRSHLPRAPGAPNIGSHAHRTKRPGLGPA